jgi:hypothetical protein
MQWSRLHADTNNSKPYSSSILATFEEEGLQKPQKNDIHFQQATNQQPTQQPTNHHAGKPAI